MISLSKKEVKRLFKMIEESHGVKAVYSRSVTAYFKKRFAKKCLASMGINKADEWLKTRWMTVVYRGRIIILCPEKIGAKGTIPWLQAVTLGHELHHGIIFKTLGDNWVLDYFLNSGARGEYHEAHAEASGADVRRYLGLRVETSEAVFDEHWKKAYKCNPVPARNVYDRLIKRHQMGRLATGSRGGSAAVIAVLQKIKNSD